jgi:hypothetical protein
MSASTSFAAGWKLCAMTCLAMVLLSLIPQLHLWLTRGRDWNGAYVSSQGDEPLYSAYVNALINGRTRKNDPFGGTDSSPNAPLPESFFSIQFVPAYVIALPSRALGVSASTAFIVLTGVAAFLASLTVFSLLNYVTGDNRLASAGTLFVLVFGCIVGRHGLFGTFLDIWVAGVPFLRRYQPALPFPLFFIFQLLALRALSSEHIRRAQVCAVLAGFTLVLLIFSHLYLWTATVAWLTCIGVLWLLFRPSDRRQTLIVLTIIGIITFIALLPYGYLLSHQAATLNEHFILLSTHRPDLFRVHEILGVLILLALAIGVLSARIERPEPRLLYAVSLALLPVVVFNQQILTGRTMQAVHFEIAVVNYSTLVGLLVTIKLLWRSIPRRILIWTMGLCIAWGVFLVALPSRLVFVPQAINNDQNIPVLRRLKELSTQDGTLADLRAKGQASTLVFSPSVAFIALMPTWTQQGALLDMTGVYCRGLTREEGKELLYMHLYYSNTDTEALRQALHGTSDKSHEELSSVRTAIFGYERTTPALTSEFKPVEDSEIENEVQAFRAYATAFSRENVLRRPITYAVIPVEGNFDFVNLDRWYKRDEGEHVGANKLYRLKLRD